MKIRVLSVAFMVMGLFLGSIQNTQAADNWLDRYLEVREARKFVIRNIATTPRPPLNYAGDGQSEASGKFAECAEKSELQHCRDLLADVNKMNSCADACVDAEDTERCEFACFQSNLFKSDNNLETVRNIRP